MTFLSLNRLAAVAAMAFVAAPAKQINVVATTPDLAALAREIGGTAVDIKTLAKPTEDPHFVDAKPSHIVTLNRADALLDGGAELEMGWLPALVESARNARIASGAAGRISASTGVKMLEVPTSFDRSKGDVHALGNPHFLMDPANAKIFATQLADRFARIAPESADLFRSNLRTFNATLDAKIAEWQRKLEPFRGAKIVSYHKDFAYLADRFGLTILETLEPKPGIAPSPAHLAKVIAAMKAANSRVILVQPYQNKKTAETVARQTGATVLDISQQPGAVKGVETYVQLMDHIVTSLATALQGAK